MNLDKRIKSLSDVLTCFDTEQAKQFKGEKGYFADALGEFKNLKGCKYGELIECEHDSYYPYWCRCRSPGYAFYIPESILKLEEKEFRPYTLEELQQIFTIGQLIKFRRKGTELEQLLIFNGYRYAQNYDQILTYIYLGPFTHTLDELFDKYEYEWQESGSIVWKPFGVEE